MQFFTAQKFGYFYLCYVGSCLRLVKICFKIFLNFLLIVIRIIVVLHDTLSYPATEIQIMIIWSENVNLELSKKAFAPPKERYFNLSMDAEVAYLKRKNIIMNENELDKAQTRC